MINVIDERPTICHLNQRAVTELRKMNEFKRMDAYIFENT